MAFKHVKENIIKFFEKDISRFFGRFTLEKRTRESRSALVILHPQKDICEVGQGYQATPQTHETCRNIGRLTPMFRRAAVPVYVVQAVDPYDRELKLGNFFGYKPAPQDKIFARQYHKDNARQIFTEDLSDIAAKLVADGRTDIFICGVSLMRDVFDFSCKTRDALAAKQDFFRVSILTDLTANDDIDVKKMAEGCRETTIEKTFRNQGINVTTAISELTRMRK